MILKTLIYSLSALHFLIAAYLLKISIAYIRDVHVDYAVIEAADRTMNGSRNVALTYAKGHMRVSMYRLVVAVLHFLIALFFGLVLLLGVTAPTNAGVFIRLLMLSLTGIQMAILYTERDTRTRMIESIADVKKDMAS